MERKYTDNNQFMIGLTCSDHKQILEEKCVVVQRGNHNPEGEIVFTPIKIIITDCITGYQEDVDESQLKRR